MIKPVYLSIFLSFLLSINLNGQVSNSKEIDKDKGIQRNASFILDELKVRWKIVQGFPVWLHQLLPVEPPPSPI